jgi:hypothetical protein
MVLIPFGNWCQAAGVSPFLAKVALIPIAQSSGGRQPPGGPRPAGFGRVCFRRNGGRAEPCRQIGAAAGGPHEYFLCGPSDAGHSKTHLIVYLYP